MAIDTIGANALATSAVTTAKIAADAVTSAKIPAGAVVASDVADGSVTTAKLADNAVTSAKALNLGRRNLVINGGMKVSQRNISVTGIGASAGYFTVDRFNVKRGNLAGRLTMSQDNDTPEGFTKSLKLDCTTADAGVEAGQYFMINYNIEGQDLQQIKKGTSNAEKVTVSFYAKGTAKTYVCEFDDSDNNRHNSIPFTVSSSWTRHTFVFNADTTGAFTKDNNLSGSINIWLSGGTSFSGGSYTANTWASRQSTDNTRAVGVGNFFDNTSNDLYITGLQMEVGDTATDFEHRSFREELEACQRYFIKSGDVGASDEWFPGVTNNAGAGRRTAQSFDGNQDRAGALVEFPTYMRSNPTVVFYPARSDVAQTAGSIAVYNGATLVTTSSKPQGRVMGLQGYFQGTSTDSAAYVFQFTADAEL